MGGTERHLSDRSARIWWLLLSVFLCGHVAFAQVVDLNSANFNEKLKSGGGWLIMFHVSWCGICKRTFPMFEEASLMQFDNENDTSITFQEMHYAQMDCTDDKSLANRFEIKGYPTILYWDAGVDIDTDRRIFRGQRSTFGFHDYMKRLAKKPVIQSVLDWETLEAKVDKEPLASFVFVKGAGSESGRLLWEKFENIAQKGRDLHRFWVAEPGQLAAESFNQPGAYVLTTKHMTHQTEVRRLPHGNWSDPAQWLLENRFPGVWRLTEKNFYDLTHSGLPSVIFVVNIAETQPAFLQRAADAFDGKGVNVGILDGAQWEESLRDFGIQKNDLPRVWVTVDNLDTWYEDRDLLSVEELYKSVANQTSLFPALREKSLLLFLQKKGTLNRAKLYLREGLRLLKVQEDWVSTGELPIAKMVGFASAIMLVSTLLLFALWWVLKAVWEALWEEEALEECSGTVKKQQ